MRILILLFIFMLSACVSIEQDDILAKIEESGIDRYTGISYTNISAHPELDGVMNYFFAPEDCRCFEGGPFMVGVEDVGSNCLIINLQGGGACWPGMYDCKSDVDEEEFESVVDVLSETNPDESWNTVFIPYCDGSNYLGDSRVDYDEDGELDRWHWGLRNVTAGLDLAKSFYPDPDKILITGCSAGGYGTFSTTLLVRKRYPEVKIYVLNESGPGITDMKTDGIWGKVRENWGLDTWLPEEFDKENDSFLSLYSWMLEHDSNLKIALYSSYEDAVLADEFLNITRQSFKEQLLQVSGEIHENYPKRFNRFFIAGDSHCVEDAEYEIAGVRYLEWVGAFVMDEPSWKDLLEIEESNNQLVLRR